MGKFAPSQPAPRVPEGQRAIFKRRGAAPPISKSILGGADIFQEEVTVDEGEKIPFGLSGGVAFEGLFEDPILQRIPTAEDLAQKRKLRRRGQGLRSTQLSGSDGPLGSSGNIRRKTLLGE